jgi:hypothetical protein
MKCPKCGTIAEDKDFSSGEAELDFTVDIETGIASCECFNCEHQWKENVKDWKNHSGQG